MTKATLTETKIKSLKPKTKPYKVSDGTVGGLHVAVSIAGGKVFCLAYTLDAIFEKGEKSAWYLQLRISDSGEQGKSIARAYTASGQPEAGQNRAEIVFKRSMLQKAADKTRETAGKAYDATRSFLTE